MSETIKISQMEVIDTASGEMMFEVSIKKNHVWHTRSVSADQLKDWLNGEFEISELGTASKKDIEFFLQSANNLSDLDDAEGARLNLGLGSAATEDSDKFLQVENNLSDLEDAEEARGNLGLGSGATSDADDFMRKDSNLSDVASVSQARGNLGLGSAATRDASDFATAAQGARADGAIPALEKGAPTGVATLNAQGKLRAEQVPRLAISEPFVVSSEQEMLALDVQVGDVAIRTDSSETFILQQEPAGDINNWLPILTPPDGVTSFNGRAGAVDPEEGDYSAEQISFGSASVKAELERLENEKVDKEAGKGLSTNDFTDADKQKLDGIEEEANKTEVVQETGGSSTAVMSQAATTAALNTKVDKDGNKGLSDNNFTNALKSKLEGIEAGATNNPSGSMGRTILTRESANQVRNDLGLKSAALRDVGTDSGNVMEVGAFGLGATVPPRVPAGSDLDDFYGKPTQITYYSSDAVNAPSLYGVLINLASTGRYTSQLSIGYRNQDGVYWRGKQTKQEETPWLRLISSGDLLSSTGNSTEYPMSQAATTDAVNAALKSQNHVYAQKAVAADSYEVSEADNGHVIFFTSGTVVDVSFASVSSPVNCVLVQAGEGAVKLVDEVVSLDDATTTRGKGAAVSLVYNVSGEFWWAGGGLE